jgi:hypothetical protein
MELTRFCRHLTVPDTEVFDETIDWEWEWEWEWTTREADL